MFRVKETYAHRKAIINGYMDMITDLWNDADLNPYFLTFKFHHIYARPETRIRIMMEDVKRVHML